MGWFNMFNHQREVEKVLPLPTIFRAQSSGGGHRLRCLSCHGHRLQWHLGLKKIQTEKKGPGRKKGMFQQPFKI